MKLPPAAKKCIAGLIIGAAKSTGTNLALRKPGVDPASLLDAAKGCVGGGGSKAGKAPNPYGSRGGPKHQDTVNKRINELEAGGHTHVGGGSKPEITVRTPKGQKRRPDITTTDPQGNIYHENVGRTNKNGDPVARERRALDDIEQATGRRPGYTPYDE